MRTAIITTALAFSALGCGNSAPNPVAPMPPPQWTLSGTVRGNEAVLGAASITITREPLPTFVTQTTTDGGGRYSFPSIDEGSYFVQAGAAGYAAEILPVTLTSSNRADARQGRMIR
jgi:hypothetical protein